jgi:endoglucanase
MVIRLFLWYLNLHSIYCSLITEGNVIVNSDSGQRVHLKCVNWYGAHQELFSVGGLERQSIANISNQIVRMGANCVRLPFSIEMVRDNPLVHHENIVAVQPSECSGLETITITALELLDCVVSRLTADGLMVIMNNHVSKAGWVGANTTKQQGLWNLPGYPTSDWIASLRNISARYSKNPLVVGMDIRNEIHDQVPTAAPAELPQSEYPRVRGRAER